MNKYVNVQAEVTWCILLNCQFSGKLKPWTHDVYNLFHIWHAALCEETNRQTNSNRQIEGVVAAEETKSWDW